MQLDPDYFGSYLGAGVAQYRAGNKTKAEELLTQSSELSAHGARRVLSRRACEGARRDAEGQQYYQAAASSRVRSGRLLRASWCGWICLRIPATMWPLAGSWMGTGAWCS